MAHLQNRLQHGCICALLGQKVAAIYKEERENIVLTVKKFFFALTGCKGKLREVANPYVSSLLPHHVIAWQALTPIRVADAESQCQHELHAVIAFRSLLFFSRAIYQFLYDSGFPKCRDARFENLSSTSLRS